MVNPLDIWTHLATSGDLEGLGIPKVDGRWDVRGLQTSKPPSNNVKGLPSGIAGAFGP